MMLFRSRDAQQKRLGINPRGLLRQIEKQTDLGRPRKKKKTSMRKNIYKREKGSNHQKINKKMDRMVCPPRC